MIRRRSIALFSMSFLDCICCGFGAIILLFVLTIGSKTISLQEIGDQLQKILQARLAQLAEHTTVHEDLRRQASARAAIDDELKKRETLVALLDDLEKQIQNQQAGRRAMLVEIDDLKKEIALRQKKPEMVLPNVKPAPVGLPVGSTFVAFVMDTSGSMRDPRSGELWPIVARKFDEVLDAYPQLDGLQFLDADGRFILGERGNAAQWLPDTPDVRDNVKRALRRYDIFSNSNPVPGIMRALRILQDANKPDMKMAIFILGDEFTGTADDVLRRIDALNPADENGNRKVVINAIAFPTTIQFEFSMSNTGLKYANLMRELTYQHGGAFIALQDL